VSAFALLNRKHQPQSRFWGGIEIKLVEPADKLMYSAKNSGKNSVSYDSYYGTDTKAVGQE
jgi:hypothetical protein